MNGGTWAEIAEGASTATVEVVELTVEVVEEAAEATVEVVEVLGVPELASENRFVVHLRPPAVLFPFSANYQLI